MNWIMVDSKPGLNAFLEVVKSADPGINPGNTWVIFTGAQHLASDAVTNNES